MQGAERGPGGERVVEGVDITEGEGLVLDRLSGQDGGEGGGVVKVGDVLDGDVHVEAERFGHGGCVGGVVVGREEQGECEGEKESGERWRIHEEWRKGWKEDSG